MVVCVENFDSIRSAYLRIGVKEVLALECPRIMSTDLDALRLLSNLGDSGSLKSDGSSRAAESHLENPTFQRISW
jgi:aminoglycoside/choline kinase family phosphotransferase